MQLARFVVTAALITSLQAVGSAAAGAEASDQASVDFSRDVRPILSDKCFFCHGPDGKHREADLRLDTHEGMLADLGGYAAVVPGKTADSELVNRITSDDEDELMPPAESGKVLTPEEIEILRRWVGQGASWQQHWAYVPPARQAPPKVSQRDWPRNWVDHFVLARLEAEALAPAPDADRVTLIRRLYFDLTGLPPSPQEVAAFAENPTPNAYEQVVNRLLASPHYGERMAMYWLDLVRYADTVGYHGDQDHNISPYRDYVIDAFNGNLRFDQFTREQLAGDLLPDATIDQRVASGYNRLLQTSHEGGVQPKEYMAIYAADRVRNVSNVWMGATMGCAQCHDHKYDPFTAKDFYSTVAFFADIDEAQHFKKGTNSLPTQRPPEIKVLSRHQRQRIEVLDAEIQKLQAQLAGLPQDKKANGTALKQQIEQLQSERKQIATRARSTMVTVAIKPRTIRILPRGNWLDDSGEIVKPAIPQFLGALETGDRRATRLDLADWLTDADNGSGLLTARVFANRFWYLLFGNGLSKVLDDFGGQGEPPVHPELLDALAVEFVESDWNIKHLMKLLVMTRAYRQSSTASSEMILRDPYNRLVARQSRYRLPAEMVRDNALAVSGLLVTEYGGASVRPYQPAGYYRHLNFPQRKYKHDGDDRQWRRGVYVHWQRQFLHPMLKAFDAPSREECAAQRPRSNTPLAALTLLNDPTFVESARAFAERILREGGDSTASRLDFAFRWTVSRGPDEMEKKLVSQLLESSAQAYAADPTAARKLVGSGQAKVADDLDPADWAAWTAVARALLNMHETITRN